ncbi:hypothetical protein BV20DRAFT_962307 [Pilatotrama ljubarskyi]|nr:hypothetical protein BV20DRAFT_962307 [Pilatotrama ljubarskyi]
MATADVCTPHDVRTTLNYYAPIGEEPPYQYVEEPPEGKLLTNVGTAPYPALVHDARGREDEFSLDTNGFQYVEWPSVERDSAFEDEERIKEKYYPEVEKILKKVAGAKRVFIFNHTIRRQPEENDIPGPQNRGPIERVHVDQTYQASADRVKRHFPEEADRLSKSRVRIINVWRPIHHPVAHKPLAVCDWRYLSHRDLVHVRYIYPDREGSTYSVKYNISTFANL